MDIHFSELIWAAVNLCLITIIPIAIIVFLVIRHKNNKKTLAKLEELERKVDNLNR